MTDTEITVPTIAPETHEHPTLGAYTVRYTVAPSTIEPTAGRFVPLTYDRARDLGVGTRVGRSDAWTEAVPCDAKWCPARVHVHARVTFRSTVDPWTVARFASAPIVLPSVVGDVTSDVRGVCWAFQVSGEPGEPLSVVLHRARTLVMDPSQPLGLAMAYADAHARESAARRAELADLLSR